MGAFLETVENTLKSISETFYLMSYEAISVLHKFILTRFTLRPSLFPTSEVSNDPAECTSEVNKVKIRFDLYGLTYSFKWSIFWAARENICQSNRTTKEK